MAAVFAPRKPANSASAAAPVSASNRAVNPAAVSDARTASPVVPVVVRPAADPVPAPHTVARNPFLPDTATPAVAPVPDAATIARRAAYDAQLKIVRGFDAARAEVRTIRFKPDTHGALAANQNGL